MTEPIFKAQNRAFSFIKKRGLDPGSIPILMQHVTGLSHAMYLANMQTELTETQHTHFWEKMDELLTGKPIQYVIGFESFYGRNFTVNEHVLIPRPETEELVVNTIKRLERLFQNKTVKGADIGTGSGAIAITMKLEVPNMTMTATDISEQALTVAKTNAENLGAEIDFRSGDLSAPLANETWDVILSNPPYIANEERIDMASSVLDYEPSEALFAEEEGLQLYRKLAEQLPEIMNKPSLIGLEIGYRQGDAVIRLFEKAFPNAVVELVQDINGKDRMIFCEIYE